LFLAAEELAMRHARRIMHGLSVRLALHPDLNVKHVRPFPVAGNA
jgi:hypothetical protein